MNTLMVTKRDGSKESFSIIKLRNLFYKIAHDLSDSFCFEELYNVFKHRIANNITTQDILEFLKLSCVDLLSIKNIYWQLVAGRLYTIQLYKKAAINRKIPYDSHYSSSSFLSLVTDYIKKGYYYSDFKKYYTNEDIKKAATFINKDRDFDYTYSTVLSFDKRYLNNPYKEVHELPQEMYLAIALFLAIPEKKDKRLEIVQSIYEVTSSQQLSLPTPILTNARTNNHQLASCFKLNVDDNLRSIYHSIDEIAQVSKSGGGVGIYFGNIRSKGAEIRNVDNASGGVVPWIKVINDTSVAVSQLGTRKSSVSPTLDIWHRDILDFLNLQTETGDIRSKAFDVFPAISVPDLFMKRVENNAQWTLFCPHEIEKVTGRRLQDNFDLKFDKFYIQCEQNISIKLKTVVAAKELFKCFLKTVVETGMPYVFFRDTVNRLNPNSHAGNIYSTQLCTEICQNTSSSQFISETINEKEVIELRHKAGDAVVCNLASINIAKVNKTKQIKRVISIALRVLDNAINLNHYPIKEAEITAQKYRSIGLGFMGLAEYLACNHYAYDSPEAIAKVDALFEEYALLTLDASCNLAQERGQYPLYKGSQWEKGILFGRDISWYKNSSLQPRKWIRLFKKIEQHGLRFSYHIAPAPNSSTSNIVGTTPGLLPIYKKFYVETNALAPIVTVAPHLSQDNFWYYKEYSKMNMKDVIKMIATIYKWVDQSISFEWMINPQNMSPKELYDLYLDAWKAGIKTIYYLRSMSGDAS